MTREPLTTKADMYAALTAGRLGNTLPQYFDVRTWARDANHAVYKLWGVRSMIPGGPGAMYLDFTATLGMLTRLTTDGVPFNVSPMVYDVTLMANVYPSVGGLYVHYVEFPPYGVSWRDLFGTPGVAKHATGIAACNLLKCHLNPNSYDDVAGLLDLYPDHVVEFSTTANCIGLLPHRNYVTWEVRKY